MTLRLRSKARLVRRPRTGAALLVYPERALELNSTALEVVELLDGTRTLTDICATIADRHPDAAEDVVHRAVEGFIAKLRSRALLEP